MKKVGISLVTITFLALLFLISRSGSSQFNYLEESTTQLIELNHPHERIELPGILREISGLEFIQDNIVACHNDEEGSVIYYDYFEKKIAESHKVTGKGDFEGVAWRDSILLLMRSDGKIFQYDPIVDDKKKKHQIDLPQGADAEGLCLDPITENLLIAFKGLPGNSLRNSKAVYAISMPEFTRSAEPFVIIDINKLTELGEMSAVHKFYNRIIQYINPEAGNAIFSPSAVSVHPKSGNIYILSANIPMLVVLNRNGEILLAKDLDPSMHKQPEGICFNDNGDLLIADEGPGGQAFLTIYKAF